MTTKYIHSSVSKEWWKEMEDLSLPIGNTPMLEIEYLYKEGEASFLPS